MFYATPAGIRQADAAGVHGHTSALIHRTQGCVRIPRAPRLGVCYAGEEYIVRHRLLSEGYSQAGREPGDEPRCAP